MKYLIFIQFFLISPFLCSSQNNTVPQEDIIVLNNNHTHIGNIIEIGKHVVNIKIGSFVHTISKSAIKRIYPAGQEITTLAYKIDDMFVTNSNQEKDSIGRLRSTAVDSKMITNRDSTLAKNDIIILNNKSKLEGEILEVSKKYIYIKVNSVVFTLKKSEIYRIFTRGSSIILMDAPAPKDYQSINPKLYNATKTLKDGFYNITYGNLIKRGEYYADRLCSGVGVQNITGIQFSKYVGLGIGIGLINFDDFPESKIIPIFTEFRGYLSEKKVSPYYNLAIGYNIAAAKIENSIDEKRKGGAFFHPAIGYKFGSDQAAFMIDLGVQIANINYEYNSETRFIKENVRYQRVVLRLGIML